jgi:cap2 methyltransferase
MFLLYSLFTSVRVYKPATSKESNSVVYVLCLEYSGRNFMDPWHEVISKYFGPTLPAKAIFPRLNIPRNFLKQIYECAVNKFQTAVTETRIRACESGRTRDEDFKEETEIFDCKSVHGDI